MDGCPNCAASGWHASALTNWDAVSCVDCGGTGYRTVERTPYGNPCDVEQVEERCACNPEPVEDDRFDYPDFDVVEVDYDRRLPA